MGYRNGHAAAGSARRRLPSPALVISALALIVAVGGGAFAIASSGNAKVKKVANKQITKRAPGLSVGHSGSADTATNAAQLGGSPAGAYERRPQWALVNSNGTILAQSGGITVNATRASFGQYFVGFGTSLANRPVSVVLHYGDGGLTGDVSATPCGGSSVPGGFDCVVASVTGVNDASHLYVRTQSDTGTTAPFGFYVTVGN